MKKFILLIFLMMFFCFAAAISQEDEDALKKKAFSFFKDNKYDKAEEIYWQLIDQGVDDASVYSDLGFILSTRPETLKEGLQFFVRAIKTDPFYTDSYANMATVCYKLGQNDNAVNYLSKAIKISPDNDEYYFSLGWIYLAGLKDKEMAIEYLKKAVNKNDKNADAHYVLGLAFADSGNKVGLLEQITKLRMLNREDLAASLENLTRGSYENKPNVYMSFESRKKYREKTEEAILHKKAQQAKDETPLTNYTYGKGKIVSRSSQGYVSDGKIITGQRQVKLRIKGGGSTTVESQRVVVNSE